MNRFNVDFDLGLNCRRDSIWLPLTEEDGIRTIADLKMFLITNQKLCPFTELEIYLKNSKLLDWNHISIIRDNETIVVKQVVIDLENNSSDSVLKTVSSDVRTNDNSCETQTTDSSDLPQLSPHNCLGGGEANCSTNESRGSEEPPNLIPLLNELSAVGNTRNKRRSRRMSKLPKKWFDHYFL